MRFCQMYYHGDTTYMLPTLQHKFYKFCLYAVRYTWRMVGVELAISIPGPRQVSLSSDLDGGRTSLPPADPSQGCQRHISRPSRPAAPTPWFPTEYAAQLLLLSHDALLL